MRVYVMMFCACDARMLTRRVRYRMCLTRMHVVYALCVCCVGDVRGSCEHCVCGVCFAGVLCG